MPALIQPKPAPVTSPALVVTRYATGEIRSSIRQPALDAGGAYERVHRDPDNLKIMPVATRPTRRSRTLDHSGERQENDSPRPGYGLTPDKTQFTAKGRLTLREFGAVVEKRFGKQALFLTGTQPGVGEAQDVTLSQYSGYAIELLTQWVRDNIADCYFAWVWERQKRGALHFHAVIAGNDKQALGKIHDGFRNQWIKVLERISDISGVDLFFNTERGWCNREFVQAPAEWVRQSAASYLAKYMGKECRRYDKTADNAVFPVRWWRVSQNAMTAIYSARRRWHVKGLTVAQSGWIAGCLSRNLETRGYQTCSYENDYQPGCGGAIGFPFFLHDDSVYLDVVATIAARLNLLHKSPGQKLLRAGIPSKNISAYCAR